MPATDRPPSTHPSAVHRQMGPRWGSWGVAMAPVVAGDDVGAAVICRRQTSPWTCVPIPLKTPLLRLARAASLEPDPLAEALCERTYPLARLVSIDPKLDELAALLVTSRPVAAQAPGCISLEGQALLWDPASTAPQCTMDHVSPPSSPVRGTLAGTVAWTAEDLPSPGEVAQRLARFKAEVMVLRQPPLISSPPKQKTPPKQALPLRSRRIAAQ
jgi:hypothetical protein